MSFKSTLFVLMVSTLSVLGSCSKDSKENENSDPTPEIFDCGIEGPISKGTRSMGLDLLDLTATGTFDDNLMFAAELGMDFIALHVSWSGLEPEPNVYSDPGNAVAILAQVAQDNGMKFSLTVRPIDITGKTVPSDLGEFRFNNMEMNERFQSLVDHIFTLLDPSVLHNLQIGNEIDGYDTSSEHEDFWSDYGSFLFESTQYIHSLAPDLKVGYTATYNGLMANQEIFRALNGAVDILGVTYYPLADFEFNVDHPSVIFNDFELMTTAFTEIDIYLQEVGYQSSGVCSSSEAIQAEFFCNFYQAWDLHAGRIKSAEFVRLNDISLVQAEFSANPYGISDEGFIEYLRTLGLRTNGENGSNKQAYDVIKKNMFARGW